MNPFALSGLINLIINPFLAAVIYFSNCKSPMHRRWAVFIMSLTVWSLGAMKVGFIGTDPARFEEALFWWRLSHVGVIFLPVTFYHFMVVFLGLKRPWSLRLAYAGGIIFTLCSMTPLMVKTVRPLYDLFYYDVPGFLYPIFFVGFFAPYSTAPFVDLWCFIKRTQHCKRRLQAQWFFLATGIGWIGGTTNFLPVWGIDIHPYGNFTCTLYPFLMAYAILHSRLMDVSVALTRTAVSLLVMSLPFLLGHYYQSAWMALLGKHWWMAPVALMGVIVALVPPAYLWFERWIEEGFARERYRYQAALLYSAKTITRIRDLNALSDYLVSMLTQVGQISHAALFLKQGRKGYVLSAHRHHPLLGKGYLFEMNSPLITTLQHQKDPIVAEELLVEKRRTGGEEEALLLKNAMESLEAILIIPLSMDDRLLGFLALGAKNSERIYNAGDIDLFITLANQVSLAIENAIVFSELTETQEEVVVQKKMASTDTLTGLMVRRTFFEQIPHTFRRLKVKSESGVLMVVDLDHFKKRNDDRGHLGGDEILKEVVQRLASSLREGDLFCRYGGDEFIIFLINTDPDHVCNVAERFCKKIADQPIQVRDLQVTQTISIGYALYPRDGEDITTLIEKADKALYIVKNRGGNGACGTEQGP